MKRLVFVAIMVLPVMVVLAMSCAPKAAPPAAPAPTRNITGVFKEITPATPTTNATVTIQTPQGPQTLPITANATFTLEGQACTLEDIGKVVDTGNTTYQCVAYYDDRLNAVTSLKVWESVGPLKNPDGGR